MQKLDKNRKTAVTFASIAAIMVGMSFAAVPAYRAFCSVTGFGGTTQRATSGANKVLDRMVTVRFDGTVSDGLAWRFKPEQQSQTLHIGETSIAYFEAENLSGKKLTGRAAFNVSPSKAGVYFKKIQCFCFTEQTLEPGEKVDMPVTYFVDPALADDRNLDEVETITLAYTFFPWEDSDEDDADGGGAGG